MTHANSSGGGQGCPIHGWLLLLLSSLQRHRLLESFLPTRLYSAAGMCTRVPAEPLLSLGGFGTTTPPCRFPSCIFFFPPNSFRLTRFPAPRADNARAGCHGAAIAGDVPPGMGTGERAQRCTDSLLGNLLRLPRTR